MMRKFKGLVKKTLRYRGQRGMTLLETTVAMTILGVSAVVMIVAMSGGMLAVRENKEEVAAQEVARTQMEYIKGCAYNSGATTYPTVSVPAGYSISVGVSSVPSTNSDIQKVTANISRDGMLIMTVTDYKLNR
jgi:prepilin-type N-terminal cleavage/methylation domain-containing protein